MYGVQALLDEHRSFCGETLLTLSPVHSVNLQFWSLRVFYDFRREDSMHFWWSVYWSNFSCLLRQKWHSTLLQPLSLVKSIYAENRKFFVVLLRSPNFLNHRSIQLRVVTYFASRIVSVVTADIHFLWVISFDLLGWFLWFYILSSRRRVYFFRNFNSWLRSYTIGN